MSLYGKGVGISIFKVLEIFQKYEEFITVYEEKITKLEGIKKMTFGSIITPTFIQINTFFKSNYMEYIEKYGIPEDGIFLPELLFEFG